MLTFLQRHCGLLVVLVGVAVLATASTGIGSDGLVRFKSLDSLLRSGKLDRSKYSMYGPIAAAPLWYLGEAIGDTEGAVAVFNRIVFLVAVVALWLTLRPVLAHSERIRFTILLLFGSMFPWHMMGFFAEAFHVACVGLGLALLVVCRRSWWAVLGGVLCVWGTANVPATAVGLAFAACVLCWHRRRLRYLALPAFAGLLILAENYLRRGDFFAGGYAGESGFRTVLPYSGRPGFSYPLFFGLLSVLFSFGKGLVYFAPGLFARYPMEVGERESDARLLYRVWLAVVVGLVLVYARWWAWYGGAVWGPRFFLFASLPASLVLARWSLHVEERSTWANVLVLIALMLSCWVGANGLVYQGRGSGRFWENNFALEYLTWYVPELSVLWQPFVEPYPLPWFDWVRMATFLVAFAFLARPVVDVLTIRTQVAVRDLWRALRAGPRWRL
jgi:hypothetical protein